MTIESLYASHLNQVVDELKLLWREISFILLKGRQKLFRIALLFLLVICQQQGCNILNHSADKGCSKWLKAFETGKFGSMYITKLLKERHGK